MPRNLEDPAVMDVGLVIRHPGGVESMVDAFVSFSYGPVLSCCTDFRNLQTSPDCGALALSLSSIAAFTLHDVLPVLTTH